LALTRAVVVGDETSSRIRELGDLTSVSVVILVGTWKLEWL